jgi:hypothetical protein
VLVSAPGGWGSHRHDFHRLRRADSHSPESLAIVEHVLSRVPDRPYSRHCPPAARHDRRGLDRRRVAMYLEQARGATSEWIAREFGCTPCTARVGCKEGRKIVEAMARSGVLREREVEQIARPPGPRRSRRRGGA